MKIFYRIKYYTTKGLLGFLGPAQLDSENDPVDRLERQRDSKLGPRTPKPSKPHSHKRHFAEGAAKTAAKSGSH